LEKVSFGVEEGKFTTLIGCNGAGKSTTLRLIAGVEATDQGEIKVKMVTPQEAITKCWPKGKKIPTEYLNAEMKSKDIPEIQVPEMLLLKKKLS
jgi:ABC-type multidrug transport system ATPase subunit